MNRLSVEQRAKVIACLTEGMSIRATVRVTGVAKNTIVKLLADLGEACADYMDAAFRNLTPQRIECDEIWSFCYSKQKNIPEEFQGTFGYGDVWTWVALDADTKLVASYLVGERTTEDCYTFLRDLRSRMVPGHRVQITTDGFGSYPPVIDALWRGNVDYMQVIKEYKSASGDEARKYSPASCSSMQKNVVMGDPDPLTANTSFVERQNLTMRMGMRRFTRLTNGFSKKVENLAYSVSIFYAFYNLCRPHQTLSGKGRGQVTPAMAAGIESHPWSLTQLCELLD